MDTAIINASAKVQSVSVPGSRVVACVPAALLLKDTLEPANLALRFYDGKVTATGAITQDADADSSIGRERIRIGPPLCPL